MRWLLDSNVLIDALAGLPRGMRVFQEARKRPEVQLIYSAITRIEVLGFPNLSVSRVWSSFTPKTCNARWSSSPRPPRGSPERASGTCAGSSGKFLPRAVKPKKPPEAGSPAPTALRVVHALVHARLSPCRPGPALL